MARSKHAWPVILRAKEGHTGEAEIVVVFTWTKGDIRLHDEYEIEELLFFGMDLMSLMTPELLKDFELQLRENWNPEFE